MIRYTNPVTEIQMPQIQVDRNGKTPFVVLAAAVCVFLFLC